MINLFNIAPQDASIAYLAKLFGTVGGVLPSSVTLPGSSQASDIGAITILSAMFQTFNSVILTVALLVVLYVVVVGVMLTAHEGQFMGKNWNNMWIPIRTVLGIAMLVPIGGGYCFLQMIIMWVLTQGVGAADSLWSSALGYVDVVGSPYAQITVPTTNASQQVNDLFKALVCDASARMSVANPVKDEEGGNYYCNGKNCGPSSAFSPTGGAYQIGPDGMCGSLTYCNQSQQCSNPNSLECKVCTAQLAALPTLISSLSAIARQFAQVDYNYRDFYQNSGNAEDTNSNWQFIYQYCSANNIPRSECCFGTGSTSPDAVCRLQPGNSHLPKVNGVSASTASDDAVKRLYLPYGLATYGDFLNTNLNQYMLGIQQAVTTYIADLQRSTGLSNPQLQEANKWGWIFAGSYYYVVANMNNSNFSGATQDFKVTLADITDGPLADYRNNVNASSTLVNASSDSTGEGLIANSKLGGLNGPINSTMNTVTGSYAVNLSGQSMGADGKLSSTSGSAGNPVSRIQSFGFGLLIAAQVLFVVLIGLTIGLGLLGFTSPYVLGTGITNPFGGTVGLLYFWLAPALFGLMGIMIIVGGMLGVYVPLIPYVIFTFGAIGWLLSCVEAMVAGPIVAVGIISPSGHHELLGKAADGLMHLFSIFLRPSLMIFGMIAAMLLAPIVVGMINAAFWTTVSQAITGLQGAMNALNPLEAVIFLCAYVMLIITALNKCFAAIYIIPERVMRWIGAHGEQHGEAEALGQVKGGADAGAGHAKSAGEAQKGQADSARSQGAGAKKLQDKIDESKEPNVNPTDTQTPGSNE